jgi:hypothetical protein
MRTWLIFMLGFGLTSLVVSLLLLPVRDVAFGVVWVMGLLAGVVALVWMTLKVFDQNRRHAKAE